MNIQPMRTQPIGIASVVVCSCLLLGASHPQHRRAAKAPPPLDERALGTQVMLDRAGYSPGEIDASMGTSTERALDVFQKHGGDAAALPDDPLTTYRITEQDA